MIVTELGAIADANGFRLSDEQLGKLGSYSELLRARNQTLNLISRKDEENIISKHILHSLTLVFPNVRLAGFPVGANVFDLGTGGGLPGIPVKIARPDISITLCDSISKKIQAVQEIAQKLGLQEFRTAASRAEELATKER